MSRMFLILSLSCYTISFFLPAFAIAVKGKTCEPDSGFAAFVVCMCSLGGILGSVPFVTWLANPSFWLGVVTFLARGKRFLSLTFAVVAFLLGMTFVFEPLIYIGYYFWLGSFVLLVAAIVCKVVEEAKPARYQRDAQP